VPDFASFDLSTLEIPIRMLERHARGIVIKPASGSAGKGVTTHITSIRQVRDAALRASLFDKELLVESQVPGECYRALVFRGRVLSIVRRTGVRLTGDGRTTLGVLIGGLADLAGVKDPFADPDVLFTLRCQNLSANDVPSMGEVALIRSRPLSNRGAKTTDVRTVYDSEVMDDAHDSIIQDAIRAAEIVGSEFLGVDIITTDIKTSLTDSGGVINEVNTTPALHHHYDSTVERFPSIALHIARDLLLTDGSR